MVGPLDGRAHHNRQDVRREQGAFLCDTFCDHLRGFVWLRRLIAQGPLNIDDEIAHLSVVDTFNELKLAAVVLGGEHLGVGGRFAFGTDRAGDGASIG